MSSTLFQTAIQSMHIRIKKSTIQFVYGLQFNAFMDNLSLELYGNGFLIMPTEWLC